MLSLAKSRCTTSINLKIHNFNDNSYTIIPLPVCDELCSTSVYGSDQVDQSRTSMASILASLEQTFKRLGLERKGFVYIPLRNSNSYTFAVVSSSMQRGARTA